MEKAAAAAWRRRPPMVGGIAVSVLAHIALLAAVAWPAAAPPKPRAVPAGRAVTVWLQAAPGAAAPAVHAAADVVDARPSTRKRQPAPIAKRAVVVAEAPAAPALPPEPTSAPAQPPAPQPVTGGVFGMPSIGFGGGAGAPPRWMRVREAPLPAQAIAAQHPMQRETAALQIAQVLQQRLAALLPPVEGGDGRCALDEQDHEALSCNSEALLQAVQADTALAGLLKALRVNEPRARQVAIAYVGGIYTVDTR